MDSLGERLTHARKSKGFTQEALAETIGVSRGVIFNLEKNKTEPQMIVMNAISQCLKINKEWLLNGEGEMHEKEDVAQSAKVLADIYALANELSEEEQLYILDVIKTYKKHFER
ncbi:MULTISPECIES: helix-turn-helix domain-containing protein [unclassified Lysinibacillus]|uniref:helix-turn-helix domain-containing protein n=1 Tax=Lysinibacillus TaxID=400634 RepID=UPI00382F3321